MRQNKLVIFIISLALCNCQPKEVKQKQVIIKAAPNMEIEKPCANPTLIYGSSFGNFFQALYRTNQFETMQAFTSNKTKAKFGNQLLPYYQNEFKFDYSLGKLTNLSYRGDTVLLTYAKAYIYGTRRKVVIPCHVENDSVKIILNNLRNPFE